MKNAFLFILGGLLFLSCSNDDSVDDGTPVPTGNTVKLGNDATFGNILTNSDGFTLYFFAPDSKDVSTCNDTCAINWPPFYQENLLLDNGLDVNDFGTITRNDGTQQNTYKGWPLYLFSNDSAPGVISGDGSGGNWFVAKPDYTVMMAKGQLVGRDLSGNETNLTSDYTEGDGETFYMTDAEGNTLYSFSKDFEGVNNFTNDNFSNNGVWPIFEEILENVPSVLDLGDFGMIDVFGRQQLTYKGWPLYYFGQDIQRGDNFGVGFPSAGVWPVLNPDIELPPVVWVGPALTFTKESNADWTLPENQDKITETVTITRQDRRQIYNYEYWQRTFGQDPSGADLFREFWGSIADTSSTTLNFTPTGGTKGLRWAILDDTGATTDWSGFEFYGQLGDPTHFYSFHNVASMIFELEGENGVSSVDDNFNINGTVGGSSTDMEALVGKKLGVWAVEEDIFFTLTFDTWGSGGSGGAVSYTRTTNQNEVVN
ncbi:hypothetical protein ACFQ1M_05080 [Sungkyunkwania multivorans]|uniref:Uncharacterized protein n=1 Tax=Sungkyunkwania multivorans TaxID=1173618 RepID=A0ABW3CUY1_9FLAO